MSEAQVTLKIFADPSGVTPGIDRAKREIDGLNAAGRTAAGGLDAMGNSGRRAGKSIADGAGQAETALQQVNGALREQIAEMADIRNITIAATAALAGMATAASVTAANFEKAIAQVSTLLSDTSGLDGLSQSVRALNREFGGGAALQAQALADIIGAGFEDAAQSVDMLRAANELAIGGITDVKTAADGLTTVMNAYGAAAGDATAVSDAFFTSALAGKTTIEQLASSIGSVAPIAAQTGVSLNEVLAATATLTRGGVATSTAMDGIRAAISSIIKPSSEATRLAQDLGLQFDAAALKSQGLAGFLAEVAEKTGGSAEKMAVLFGGVEALAPVLTLTGQGAQGFARDLEAMANKAGATEGAVTKMTDTASFQAGRLAAAFEDSLISAGTSINEALGPAVKSIADNFDTIESVLVTAAQAALFFAGIKGLAAIPVAVGAVSTALAALVVRLNLVTPLFAFATQGMAGTTAAMLGLRNAGGAVLAMLGGWPTVVAAAALGLGVLIAQLMSAQERAQAAAEQMRRDYEDVNRRFIAARQQFRLGNADVIGADIAAQEDLIRRMTGRFSEQSVAMQSARQRLVELQAEYQRAGGSLEQLTGTQTAANAALQRHNAGIREQIQQMRAQIAAATGGAAAAASVTRSQIDMSQASAEQRRETALLESELRKVEAQLKAVQGATTGKTQATRASSVADRDAADAARQLAAGQQQLAALIARQEAAMNPAQAAAIRYRETMLEIAAAYQAIVANGGDAATALATMQQAQGNAARQLLQDTQETATAQTGLADAAQRAAEDSARYWAGAGDAILRALGDGVVTRFRGTADQLRRIGQQIVSDLVAQFARPIMLNIGASLGGGVLSSLFAGQGAGGAAVAGAAGGAAGGAGAGFLGGILGGIGASIGGFTAGLGVAGSAGILAATQFGAASLAAGNLAVGFGALAGALGPVALALGGINALTGGRLFGTSFRTDRAGAQFDFGDTRASGFSFQEQSRRRSLFRGTRRRTVTDALGEDAQAQIDALFEAVGQQIAQDVAALSTTVPPRITASFRATTDASGNVISEVGTILGRQYNESLEQFGQRLAAEQRLATLDTIFDGEASRIADAWRSSADTLADGAQFLLAAATDLRGGFDLLGDASLTGVAELVQRLAGDGESLTAAYQRIAGATRLLEEAVALSGVTLTHTREQFVEFAAGIAEAAGGLERAQQLFQRYFSAFYTEQERGLFQLQQATARASTLAAGLGLDLGSFTGEGGAAAFRQLLESQLPTLSAEGTVQMLEFADALATVLELQGRYTEAVISTAETITEFMGAVESALAEFAPALSLQQQLDAQRTANEQMLARAIELGASEEQLARVRELGALRIDAIIGGVQQQTATLTGTLRRLGIAAVGTREQIAVAAAALSEDFGALFDEFLGSFYSDAERQALAAAQAQLQLAQAMQAAGLAAEDNLTREQLRLRIEQALAAGNYALAESLLRVARAMNQVESATASIIETATGIINGAGSGGTIIGPGGGGDPGDGLAEDIERIRRALRDWLTSLTTGDLSPERPRDQLRRAQAEYQRLLTLAQGGDAQALQQLQGASELVLRLGRQVSGSSAGYTALYNQILSQVGALVGFTPGGGAGSLPGVTGLEAAATSAAAALDAFAARLGMPMGSLTTGLQSIPTAGPAPQWIASAEAFDASPVVAELRASRAAAAAENERLRRELEALRGEMSQVKQAQQRVAVAAERANDLRR